MTAESVTPRLENETPKAYAAFLAYRNLGLRRTLAEARLVIGDGSVGCLRVLEEWSARFGWVERCREFDNYVQLAKDRAIAKAAAREAGKWERRRQEGLEQNYQFALAIRRVAGTMLEAPLFSEEVEGDDGRSITVRKPGKWSFRDVAALAHAAVEIESMMLRAASKSLEGMSDDELEAVADVFGGTEAPAGVAPGEAAQGDDATTAGRGTALSPFAAIPGEAGA